MIFLDVHPSKYKNLVKALAEIVNRRDFEDMMFGIGIVMEHDACNYYRALTGYAIFLLTERLLPNLDILPPKRRSPFSFRRQKSRTNKSMKLRMSSSLRKYGEFLMTKSVRNLVPDSMKSDEVNVEKSGSGKIIHRNFRNDYEGREPF